jgi:long-chain acyl-CoA synthetase
VTAAVEQANAGLSRVEQIKTFKILPVDWLPGGVLLGDRLALELHRRGELVAAEIEALYAGG